MSEHQPQSPSAEQAAAQQRLDDARVDGILERRFGVPAPPEPPAPAAPARASRHDHPDVHQGPRKEAPDEDREFDAVFSRAFPGA